MKAKPVLNACAERRRTAFPPVLETTCESLIRHCLSTRREGRQPARYTAERRHLDELPLELLRTPPTKQNVTSVFKAKAFIRMRESWASFAQLNFECESVQLEV